MATSPVTRRDFVRAASAGVAAAAWGLRARADEPRRPNVVLMLGDDLRCDAFGAFGNPVAKTPNFDAVVREGCVFRHAYTMGAMVGAVCMPSRTMLLTGRSLFRAANEPSGADPATFTLPRAMKSAGYATLHAGKYGNSPRRVTDEFDETFDPGNAGQVADKAVDFIRRNASKSPLFLYIAGKEPHDPQYAPDEFYAQFDPNSMPLPETFAPYHPFDNGEMTVRDEMTLPFPRTPEDIRRKRARYFASLAYLDTQFGRVVEAMKDAGEHERTIYVVAGDNGLSLGDHGLLGKQNLYEFGGMHVPLVFAGPGIAHAETPALAYLMDIFPTICALAGIPTPANVEGQSLAPVIRQEQPAVREWLYTAYKDVQRSVTDGRWKLTRYPKVDVTQLFDLQNDPHETHDLTSQPEQAERVRAMLEKLAELQKTYDDPTPLRVPDPQPAAWSPDKLTPEQIRFQVEETARNR